MKQVIYKYPLEVKDEQTLELPAGTTLLSVAEQYGCLQLWAMLDPETEEKEKYEIIIRGTGHTWETDGIYERPLGTVLLAEGRLVWHVFERIRD